MTILEIVQYALNVLPYLLMAVATLLAVMSKTRLDEIAHLLWVIVSMLIIIASTVSQ